MFQVDLKPTLRIVNLIAALERFAGRWDRISLSPAMASNELETQALREGAAAALSLDVGGSGVSALITALLSDENLDQAASSGKLPDVTLRQFRRLIEAHKRPFDLSLAGIVQLFGAAIDGIDLGASIETMKNQRIDPAAQRLDSGQKLPLRSQSGYLSVCAVRTDGLSAAAEEMVFPTISPFLVRGKLLDLIEWTQVELKRTTFHPLLVIAIFHLMFLQLSPFPSGNVRLSLLIAWKLLDQNGFTFVRHCHFATELHAKSVQYANTLRQAERTANTTWASVNIWIEFFLDALKTSSDQLASATHSKERGLEVTHVQRRIMDVIRRTGRASRELIVTETGINLSTVKYNLTLLATRGHLAREGGGRATAYRIV